MTDPPPIAGRVAVLLPVAVSHAFDYLVPEDMELRVGDFVRVPFRGGRVPTKSLPDD